MGTSDALPEETAVMVQTHHTSLTFSAVIHIDSLTITFLAKFYNVCFLQIHVPFTNDTRIHEDCEEPRQVHENQGQNVKIYQLVP